MENIYDVRKKEELLYILSQEKAEAYLTEEMPNKTAVVITLFYETDVSFYMEYLNNIPDGIDVFVFSSNPMVLEQVEKLKKRFFKTLWKENRGRDVSALLVEFRRYLSEYQYICYVHDKKEKQDFMTDDVRSWVACLWDNLIGSVVYINNVLALLDKSKDIGLLVPPEPFGKHIYTWYSDAWNHNFENCTNLANRLGLQCCIEENKPPITLGTAFWAKTEALKKLFLYEWKYEDFPEEPLANDGTISHAIERIFGYVAQDAGYKTATIMTEKYAVWNLLEAQDGMRKMMQILNQKYMVKDLHGVEVLLEKEKVFRNFFTDNKKVYIYGAGTIGKRLLQWCKEWRLPVAGFVVSDMPEDEMVIDGVAVYKWSELSITEGVGIVIAVAPNLLPEIEKEISDRAFLNYIYGN